MRVTLQTLMRFFCLFCDVVVRKLLSINVWNHITGYEANTLDNMWTLGPNCVAKPPAKCCNNQLNHQN